MTESMKPYTKRMYDAENEYRIYADIPDSLYKKFKHALVDQKIRQKKAITEAIKLWLDNQDNIKSNCLVCGKPLDFKGFLIYGNHTLESAMNSLKRNMICDNPKCTIELERIHNIDNYNALKELHSNDAYDFCDAIWKSWGFSPRFK